MFISVKDITFGFTHQRKILDGINLFSKGDEIISIVGSSGSGKSTLLRILCGIIEKNKSNIFQGQININGLSPKEFTKQGNVGFMFQEPTLLPNLSVRENIELPLKFINSQNNNYVNELIKMVGLADYFDYLPAQLSGGMSTRVALARIFVSSPKLLFLDEPFSSLDVNWKFSLYRELEILRAKSNATIIMVTHDIQEAVLLSNHIVVLGKNGKILKEIIINKPLPRVFNVNSIKDLQEEFLEIQTLIMEN